MVDTAAALRWIADLLDREDIPYVVGGGLAARAYGATRPLADIDLYVPDWALPHVAGLTTDRVTRAPTRHVGDQWDLVFMRLEYAGQKIELAGTDEVYIRSSHEAGWHQQHIDFSATDHRDVGYGIEMPVMPRSELLAYKRLLDRAVDRQDIAALEGSG